jgi:hypothetical protein
MGQLGGGVTHNGVSTRLLWVYFGLCFIAAANVIYGFMCPQEVKEYPTANAYIVGDGDSIGYAAIEEIENQFSKSEFRGKSDIYIKKI